MQLKAQKNNRFQLEKPKYQVISVTENIETRAYDPIIVAKVAIQGERKKALDQGFKILLGYISGNNFSKKKIAMTAPVMQHAISTGWNVLFFMPAEYAFDQLPQAIDKQIEFQKIHGKKVAAIQFSGSNTDTNLNKNEEKLRTYLSKNKLKVLSSPTYAFYNSPLTLSFLKRNEIMIEIE